MRMTARPWSLVFLALPALWLCCAGADGQTVRYGLPESAGTPLELRLVSLDGVRYAPVTEVAAWAGARTRSEGAGLELLLDGRSATLRSGSREVQARGGPFRLDWAPRFHEGQWLVAAGDMPRLFSQAFGLELAHRVALRDPPGEDEPSIEMRDLPEGGAAPELQPLSLDGAETDERTWRPRVIVIDPGHGGSDTGAEAGSLTESAIALDVARALSAGLTARLDAEVYLTRDSDEDTGPHARANVAVRREADLLLSIHVAESMNAAARGVEAYVADQSELARLAEGRRGRVRDVLLERRDDARLSQAVAETMLDHLAETAGAPNRGVRPGRWRVLRHADAPGALFEVGFLSNPSDAQKLAESGYRQAVAEALAEGLARYVQAD